MTEKLPDEELTVVDEDSADPLGAQPLDDESLDAELLDAESLDPVLEGRPDAYPGAAEQDPDRWQEDPLLQDEPGANASADDNGIGVGDDGDLSDQALRAETSEARYEDGEEQIPPEEPRIGEAAADVDFGMMEDDEADGSDDPANRGGAALSAIDDEPDAIG